MPKIFNISANLPFLDSLAARILQEYQQLQSLTIYLPSKRAVRELADSFLRLSGKPALLLPNIQAVGDIEDDELEFSPKFAALSNIKPVISKPKRLMEMAKLLEGKQFNFVQSMLLAKSLIKLIDETQNKGIEFKAFEDVIPAEFAQHWQITLDFLKIAGQEWQEMLEKQGVIEPITHRNLVLQTLADYYKNEGKNEQVIVAGSTGSVPATANLIEAIGNMPNGKIVLFGLDEFLTDDDFALLEETHPQKDLARLLLRQICKKSEVEAWQNSAISAQQKLISMALLPTHKIDLWQSDDVANLDASKTYFIEAESEENEAAAVAMAAREVLEHESLSCIIVTNNRDLAKRISSKMKIWGVELNDSAGQPLHDLPAANFMLLMADMILAKFAPIELLAFFKHPFIPLNIKEEIRKLEIDYLHGPRLERLPPLPKGFELADFAPVFEQKSVSLKAMLLQNIEISQNLAPQMWENQGIELKEYLEELLADLTDDFEIDPKLYADFLRQILGIQTYRPKYGQHPRVSILTPQEARLLTADVVIIAGMNEGSFPQLPAADSFMNQQIRKNVGLDLLEKRIGQAAHDFELLANAKKVILTRSRKEDGSPATKSRFLQRLQAIATLADGQKYIAWADEFFKPADVIKFPRPRPKPPASARPNKLSATKIGKLLRDPYSIYAEKVLNLRKLDDLDADLTAADFGNFVHDALEKFGHKYDGKLQTLILCGTQAFEKYQNFVGAKAFWWPKFERIAQKFIELERGRRTGQDVILEHSGKLNIGGFTITAKADRLELADGLTIIDYKSGTAPTKDEVARGLEPQLPIEAIIFEKEFAQGAKSLEYWQLGNGNDDIEVSYIDVAQVEQTRQNLPIIAKKMQDENTPFLARPWSYFALKYNDYSHLERISEWE